MHYVTYPHSFWIGRRVGVVSRLGAKDCALAECHSGLTRMALDQAKSFISHGFTPDSGVAARKTYINEHRFNKAKSTCFVAKCTMSHIRIAFGSAVESES